MNAVFKREIRFLFHSIPGICAIVAYLVVFGVLFTAYNLNFGYPEVDAVYLLGALPITAVCGVLGCTAFYDERKNQSGRFLAMLPLSRKDIVLGKFFARFVFLMIPTAVVALYPVILDSFGEINYLGSYSMLLALCFYQGFSLAISMMFSAVCKNVIIPFFCTCGIFLLGFLVPYVPTWLVGAVSEQTLATLQDITVFLSPYAQLDYFSIGIFDIRKIVWLAVFTSGALFVSWFCFNNGRGNKSEE